MTPHRALTAVVSVLALVLLATAPSPAQTEPASLKPARPPACHDGLADCGGYDALVFVHGIYGGDTTFVNDRTRFDWVANVPREIGQRPIDVYRLNYRTELLAWAKAKNPSFDSVAKAIFDVMSPLRRRQYRSIGFIAHSLGGNFVSTYIHMVKTALGHPQRSQHAFVITLGTPVAGAQIADLTSVLKSALFMSDPLLESLKHDNLYLVMLNNFRSLEAPKGDKYGCRPVNLHAAYEKDKVGPILIVQRGSAAEAVSRVVNSPVVGFDRDHLEIVKPPDREDEVFQWVNDKLNAEYLRLATWDRAHDASEPGYRLCDDIRFKPESQ